jgi:hypothetical protein
MRLNSYAEQQGDDGRRTDATGLPCFTRSEARLVFAEMVRSEMRNGPLTSWRRRRLIQYAAILNLTPLDAGRIVTDVWYERRTQLIELAEAADQPELELVPAVDAGTPARWPLSLQLGLTLILGFVISRVWIYFS